MIYVSVYETVNMLSLARDSPELSADGRKNIISGRRMAPAFGRAVPGLRPRCHAELRSVGTKRSPLLPQHSFLVWVCVTSQIFGGCESSASICLYKMLMTQKLSSIH